MWEGGWGSYTLGCPEFPLFPSWQNTTGRMLSKHKESWIPTFQILISILWPIATTFIEPVVIKEGGIWTKKGLLWTFYWHVLLAWFLSITDTFSSFQMMDVAGKDNKEHNNKWENRERPRGKVEVNWKYWLRVWHIQILRGVAPRHPASQTLL